jgi:hypothetical protein
VKETDEITLSSDVSDDAINRLVARMKLEGWYQTSIRSTITITFEREIPDGTKDETCEDCGRDCGKNNPPPASKPAETSGDPGYFNDEHPTDYGGFA